jgi:hypothetical protein
MSETKTEVPSPDDLRAKVFGDREHSGDWRVEKMDEDGGIELTLFSGGDARQRAIAYAGREYGEFDEIELRPYHRAPPLGQVLDDLSASGITVNIETLSRGGYVFRLGRSSGNIEGSADNIFYLSLGLCAYAVENFPESRFAEQYRGATL